MEAWHLAIIMAIVIIVLWILVKNYRVNKFRRNVKIGDVVIFYIGDLKCRGIITHSWKKHVNIRHWTSPKVYRRSKKAIY